MLMKRNCCKGARVSASQVGGIEPATQLGGSQGVKQGDSNLRLYWFVIRLMSCKNKETFAFWTLEYLHWPTKHPSHCPSSFSSFFSLINNIYKTHYNLSKSPIQLPQLPNCLIPVHFGDIAPFSLRVSLSAPFFICGPSQAFTAVGQSIFLVLLLFLYLFFMLLSPILPRLRLCALPNSWSMLHCSA